MNLVQQVQQNGDDFDKVVEQLVAAGFVRPDGPEFEWTPEFTQLFELIDGLTGGAA